MVSDFNLKKIEDILKNFSFLGLNPFRNHILQPNVGTISANFNDQNVSEEMEETQIGFDNGSANIIEILNIEEVNINNNKDA